VTDRQTLLSPTRSLSTDGLDPPTALVAKQEKRLRFWFGLRSSREKRATKKPRKRLMLLSMQLAAEGAMCAESFLGATQKAGISLACAMAERFVKIRGGTALESDKAALELAKFISMRPNGRAAAFLDHFIKGSGADVHFKMKDLWHDDPSVRVRIELEILRKMSNIKVGTERHNWCYDPCVTLFQKNFSNRDWWYALGSFDVDWAIVRSDQHFHTILLSGKNEYKWHPEETRITQCLHQAGDRLARAGSAKNFWMISDPHKVIFSETQRKIVEMTTVHSSNPEGGLPQIGFDGVRSRLKGL
jgi:hypothetical protein